LTVNNDQANRDGNLASNAAGTQAKPKTRALASIIGKNATRAAQRSPLAALREVGQQAPLLLLPQLLPPAIWAQHIAAAVQNKLGGTLGVDAARSAAAADVAAAVDLQAAAPTWYRKATTQSVGSCSMHHHCPNDG
jgi:hypothetical protein